MARTKQPRSRDIQVSGTILEQMMDVETAREVLVEDPVDVVVRIETRKRGPTFLSNVWAQNGNEKRIQVKFNQRGQPLDNNKTHFSEFLGVLSRNGRFCPIDIENWHKMSIIFKKDMLELVKERYDVPPGVDHIILHSIAKKWKAWKSNIKTKYYDPTKTVEQQMNKKVDKRVVEGQWKRILAIWDQDQHKERCRKNTENRKLKMMMHTTGKRSFADVEEDKARDLGRAPSRAEMFDQCYTKENGNPSGPEVAEARDKMVELQKQLPVDSHDEPDPNDIFGQVIGDKTGGRVLMFGLGITSSDIWGDLPSRRACYRLLHEQKKQNEKFSDQIIELQSKLLQDKDQGPISPQGSHIHIASSSLDTNCFSPSNMPSSSIRSESLIKIGDTVILKSLICRNKLVAHGVVESVNPTKFVGGQQLGPMWCEVQIDVPIEFDEMLIRPYSTYRTIGDVIGVPIAWPCNLVVQCEA